jgi:hypothetical protein
LLYSLNDAVNVLWGTSCVGAMAEQQDRSSPHPCGITEPHGLGECGQHGAGLRSMLRMGSPVGAAEGP